MAMEQSVNTSALKTEEAALLPALPRHTLSSRLALQAALQQAAAMKGMRTGNAVDAARMAEGQIAFHSPAENGNPAAFTQPHRTRAALCHILRKR